jgi:cytochrome c oxidase subunit 2
MSVVDLPPAASTFAPPVDALFYAVLATTFTVALAIVVALLYLGIRYRTGNPVFRHEDIPAAQARLRRRVELAWTLTPLLLFLAAFAWAARLYVQRGTPPPDALRLDVVAKQWMWTFQHPGGQRELDELHVPLGQPVRLVMTSQDVIHSFFVPALRVKQDVLPGRYTEAWFTATQAGRFHLFCAEYCGTGHARMGSGTLVVEEPAEFQRWLAGHAEVLDAAARGAALFRQNGCSGCHGASATVHAPDLAGLYGRTVALAGGGSVVADDRYLRDSILLPQKEIAAGYAPIMPSFAGRIGEEDLFDLVAYLRSLTRGTERPR